MPFQNYAEFEVLINHLCHQEQYDLVDEYLDNQIDEITQLASFNEIEPYLDLYASMAGDGESVARFERLFEQLVKLDKIDAQELAKYLAISPANRWF